MKIHQTLYIRTRQIFTVRSTKTYKDTIVKYDKDLRKLNEVTKGSVIKKHEKLNNGVTVVTYDNGTKIYVNYTSVSRTVDGVKVGAMSYSYKAGETE